MKLTNHHGISLPLAVWLLQDSYDYVDDPKYISATSLLKSTKQLILSRRVEASDREMDISDLISARFGQVVHDSIEKAWKENPYPALKRLGYSENIISRIQINPDLKTWKQDKDTIPVWIEQRAFRELDGWTIGGKFDLVIDGRLFDTKTTSVYSYLLGSKDKDYGLQGGIYRWLNPEIITSDHVYIQFLFTDWQRSQAKRNPDYPQTRAKEYPVPLPSLEETETFIRNKLSMLSRYMDAPEEEIPQCTDEELWRGPTVYKYYADPNKTSGRSTRNFDTLAEANSFKADRGGKGVVIAVPGEVKACEYCPAFNICRQKDLYYGL